MIKNVKCGEKSSDKKTSKWTKIKTRTHVIMFVISAAKSL